ncbi:DUF3265 domain-containing protein [Vibrio vulnificus]|nr:DUF3265 domain-containing protein [Vibrio vulnificus]MCG6299620.1 DUF3265 domain-containing protein [Vibrio vulnificus]
MRSDSRHCLTNNLRVIQHAWHFGFWSSLVITASKLSVVVTCFTP